jgi:hypothetical protein
MGGVRAFDHLKRKHKALWHMATQGNGGKTLVHSTGFKHRSGIHGLEPGTQRLQLCLTCENHTGQDPLLPCLIRCVLPMQKQKSEPRIALL